MPISEPTPSPRKRGRLFPRWGKRLGLPLVLAGLLLDLHWALWRFPAYARERTVALEGAPWVGTPVLVLGAGVYADGEPTQVLEARLGAALGLFRAGKASWILVSGDNRSASYNEPQAMRRWLQRQGVPPERIVLDFAGRRTYDSLKRANLIFGVERAYLVTSDFHLPRALYLAHHLGVDAYGVPCSTGEHGWGARLSFWVRELGARHKALLDLWFPPDVMLGHMESTPDLPSRGSIP